MDVQMAEMDGLEATKAIRAWEKASGTHTPIIAMTAHAMKGDGERCLAAGMDGYTSKPIRIGDLAELIDQLISPLPSANAHGRVTDREDRTIDEAAVLAGVGEDRQLLREVVRLFLADYPQRLVEIKDAIRRCDAGGLWRAAHTLKGSVGNFAATKAFAAAQRVESIGENGELGDAASEACATLESELALLGEQLRKLTKKPSVRRARIDKNSSHKRRPR
jgi:HPt (histidine-containing phosphotransfer) domain-containing protein